MILRIDIVFDAVKVDIYSIKDYFESIQSDESVDILFFHSHYEDKTQPNLLAALLFGCL